MRMLLAALVLLMVAPTAMAATEVKAMGGFFAPDSIAIAPGEEVVWTNEDSMPHTITSTWDSGASFDAVLRGGESFAWTFADAGDFKVHCRPHAYPNESGGMDGMAMSVQVAPLESVAEISKPVPGPAIALVLAALVGVACFSRR